MLGQAYTITLNPIKLTASDFIHEFLRPLNYQHNQNFAENPVL